MADVRGIPSFGRPAPAGSDPDEGGPVMLPPIMFPRVQVPVVLTVDATALKEAAQVIQEMVAQAVSAGVAQALGDPGAGGEAATPQ